MDEQCNCPNRFANQIFHSTTPLRPFASIREKKELFYSATGATERYVAPCSTCSAVEKSPIGSFFPDVVIFPQQETEDQAIDETKVAGCLRFDTIEFCTLKS